MFVDFYIIQQHVDTHVVKITHTQYLTIHKTNKNNNSIGLSIWFRIESNRLHANNNDNYSTQFWSHSYLFHPYYDYNGATLESTLTYFTLIAVILQNENKKTLNKI